MTTRKIVVVDIYDPMHLEQLEQGKELPRGTWELNVQTATHTLNQQLAMGDFFLCASDRQRPFYLGQLAALGRLNPATYEHDPHLRKLLAEVPFGLLVRRAGAPAAGAEGRAPGHREERQGADVGRRALQLVRPEDPDPRGRQGVRASRRRAAVLPRHASIPAWRRWRSCGSRASSRASSVCSTVSVFFNDTWVEYDDRANYLLESDAGVSAHKLHIETTFAFRTRILDYLWAGLPMVVTEGDSFADLVKQGEARRRGAARRMPRRSRRRSSECCTTRSSPSGARRNIARVRKRFTWERVLKPLTSFMRKPRHAADRLGLVVAPLLGGLGQPSTGAHKPYGLRHDVRMMAHHLRHSGPRVGAAQALDAHRRTGAAGRLTARNDGLQARPDHRVSPARTAPTSLSCCWPRDTRSTASSAGRRASTPSGSTTCTTTRTRAARGLELHFADLTDGSRLSALLASIQPQEVYHLAAQSHVRVSFDEPEYTADTTGLGTVRLLEAIRQTDIGARFYQASSSEMFGATPPPQNEDAYFWPRSPYGAAKVYAYWIARNYREAYGMFVVNGILFNHESPRRGKTFVTHKITEAAARIKAGPAEGAVTSATSMPAATGATHPSTSWRCGRCCSRTSPPTTSSAPAPTTASGTSCAGRSRRSGSTGRSTCKTDERYLRPTEVDSLVGDASKAFDTFGWRATVHTGAAREDHGRPRPGRDRGRSTTSSTCRSSRPGRRDRTHHGRRADARAAPGVPRAVAAVDPRGRPCAHPARGAGRASTPRR